MTGDTNRAVHS